MSPKESGDVSWYSTSQNVATVDEKGYVTAVGEGTTSIVYKTAAGKEGKCTVTVNQPKSISLTGGIDPTFYTTDDEMNKFDKKAYLLMLYTATELPKSNSGFCGNGRPCEGRNSGY